MGNRIPPEGRTLDFAESLNVVLRDRHCERVCCLLCANILTGFEPTVPTNVIPRETQTCNPTVRHTERCPTNTACGEQIRWESPLINVDTTHLGHLGGDRTGV
jgi:hypothetical protein